jgi:molybdopterin-guanine dinucleotide biosynthesis protein A
VSWTGVVLAGGASRRMGVDKALVEVDGVAMAARVARALTEGGCNPVLCQGGDAEALATLGLAVIADSQPGGGPLAGILDALAAADSDIVVTACDLPWLDGDTVHRLLTAAAAWPDADVVVAYDVHGPHLAGAWRARARQPLEHVIAGGVRSYRAALERLNTARLEVPASVVANVNSPDDLDRRR